MKPKAWRGGFCFSEDRSDHRLWGYPSASLATGHPPLSVPNFTRCQPQALSPPALTSLSAFQRTFLPYIMTHLLLCVCLPHASFLLATSQIPALQLQMKEAPHTRTLPSLLTAGCIPTTRQCNQDVQQTYAQKALVMSLHDDVMSSQ